MNNQKIYYRKVRDLGGVFSATFGFIKQNFKTFYGSLLFLAGPFLLVAVTISTYTMGSMVSIFKLNKGLSSILGELFLPYATSMFVLFIGLTVYQVVLNKNIIENEKLQANETLTLKHIIANFFGDFWRMLGNALFFILIIIISVIVFSLIFAGLGSLFTGAGGGTGGAIALAIILVLVVLVLMIIFGPILSFLPIATMFVCQRDKIFIIPALQKVFKYLKGNFWSTWLVSFIALLCYMVMGFVAQIPVLIVTLFTTFSRMKSTVGYGVAEDSTPLLLIIVTVISTLLSYGVMTIYFLMSTYQYTNLEEKKEGTSIIDKINQIQ